ncbi:MAG: CPBP family intramembrane metalloprotease [Phycisphaerales bacterium]|nr:MAG: CPBP family intramembrane metalloprotease [Phycisphaerales bacterium]
MRRFFVAVAKTLAYVIGVWIAARVVAVPIKMQVGRLRDLELGVQIALIGLFVAAGVALVNSLMVWVGKSNLIKAGWPPPRAGLRGFGFGALLGLAMCAGMLLLTLVTGGARFTLTEGDLAAYLLRIFPLLGCLLLASLGEELLFRGYPLTVFAHALGRGWANLLLAVLFSAAHAAESGFNGLIALNIVVGSLTVGAIRFTSGGIPAAWGFHFAWNGLQVLAGSTLSGEDYGVPLVRLVNDGPAVFSGAAFGPEGGLGATFATVIMLVFLARYFRRRGLADLPVPFARSRPLERSELVPPPA